MPLVEDRALMDDEERARANAFARLLVAEREHVVLERVHAIRKELVRLRRASDEPFARDRGSCGAHRMRCGSGERGRDREGGSEEAAHQKWISAPSVDAPPSAPPVAAERRRRSVASATHVRATNAPARTI